MQEIRLVLALTLASVLALSLPAFAQSPFALPGTGGEAENKPAVRLAGDDPRVEVQTERQALMDQRDGLALRNQDAQLWRERQKGLRDRRAGLQALRRRLLLKEPPTRLERRWTFEEEVDIVIIPDVDPVAEGDGGLDGGVSDGGPDGGISDGDVGDTGLDGGVGDGGTGDGGAGDGGAGDGGVAVEHRRVLKTNEVILPVFEHGDGFLTARTHPAQIVELERLLVVLDRLDEALASNLRMVGEERVQLSKGIARADALLLQMELDAREGNEKASDDAVKGVKVVEGLALKVEKGRIALSLARATERQGKSAETGEGGGVAALEELKGLSADGAEPFAAFSTSFAEAETLRDEVDRARDETKEAWGTLSHLRGPVQRARTRRHRLELMSARRGLAALDRDLQEAMTAMVITEAEIEWATKKFENSKKLRQKEIPVIEASLDKLREVASKVSGSTALFGKSNVLEVKRTFLSEKLFFERLKLERDAFRASLAEQLGKIMDGVSPPLDFLERYEVILSLSSFEARHADLEGRCDGWRRAQYAAQRKKLKGASPLEAENKKTLLGTYEALANICMREEWVMGTQSRLGTIARFHLDRLERKQRDFWWYSWRTILSATCLLLALLISRWMSAITRRMAGHSEDDEAPIAVAPTVPPGPVGTETQPQLAPPPRLKAAVWRVRMEKMRALFALGAYLGGMGLLWSYGGILVARFVWGLPVGWQNLIGWLTHPILMLGDRGVSIWSVFAVLLWTVISVWTGRIIHSFIADMLQHFGVERGIRDTVGTIARYVVISAGVSLGLSSVGIGLGALALVFGVVGIGIGFGLQNIASNFISGFIILLERPIRKGDFIQVGDMIGEVKEISARATTIETRDAVSVIVPNAEFISDRVINWTLGRNERVRTKVQVGVAYGTDVRDVRRALLAVARGHSGVLKWPRSSVQMVAFGDSSLDFILYVWTDRIRTLPVLVSDLNIAVEAEFRARNIEIPFPQRDVHHYQMGGGGDDGDSGVGDGEYDLDD